MTPKRMQVLAPPVTLSVSDNDWASESGRDLLWMYQQPRA